MITLNRETASMPNAPRQNITTREFKADPFPFYAQLRAKQPVYRAKYGKIDAWLVTRYDDVLAVLRDERFVKDRRNVGGSGASYPVWIPPFLKPLLENMLDLDDPNHARLRTLVHKAFTPRRIAEMHGQIQAIADGLLDAMVGKAEIDLVRDYALPLPLTVIAELLGLPQADHGRFAAWLKALIQPPSSLNMVRTVPAVWQFMRYTRRLLRQRRAEPRDDLLTALAQAEEAGDRMSEDEVLAMVFLLLVAGHETTVNLIASGTLALLEHPWELARLRDEPSLIKPALEELLRFTDPVETATERFAREDLALAGMEIQQGDLVLAVLASANRDENYFTRPDVLNITREPNKHLAFGHGAHYCLGAPLARMEGSIAINSLLARQPNLQLAIPAESLRWRATPTVRGLEALPMRL